jgi:hypothetical protein
MKHTTTARPPAPVGAPDGRHSIEEWRCERCNKLLGVIRHGRLHIRFSHGHEYRVGLPATCTCRSCRTLCAAPLPRMSSRTA